MSQDRSPIRQVLDLAIFGPLGLALAVRDALPQWIEIRRGRVEHQVEVAKVVGEHATRYGQQAVHRALVDWGVLPGPPPPSDPSRGIGGAIAASTNGAGRAAPPSSDGRARSDGPARSGRPQPRGSSRAPSPPATAPPGAAARPAPTTRSRSAGPVADQLAIPGYDSLSAFQVVQRLAGLSPPELDAVRVYESEGRARRTILTKITQLQAGRP